MHNISKKKLSPAQREELLRTLKARFEKHMNRHKGLEWAKVQAKLEANARKQEAETNLAYARKGNEILGSVFAGLDHGAPLQRRGRILRTRGRLHGGGLGSRPVRRRRCRRCRCRCRCTRYRRCRNRRWC